MKCSFLPTLSGQNFEGQKRNESVGKKIQLFLPTLPFRFCPLKFLMFVPTLSAQNFKGQKRNESVGKKAESFYLYFQFFFPLKFLMFV